MVTYGKFLQIELTNIAKSLSIFLTGPENLKLFQNINIRHSFLDALTVKKIISNISEKMNR